LLEIAVAGGRLQLLRNGKRHVVPLLDQELDAVATKPILKWAGGKQWLAAAAPLLAPKNFNGRYYEPFLGGAAFFLALQPTKATLADKNQELIETYKAIACDHESVISLLRTYPYDKSFYYKIRDSAPRSMRKKAARLIFLNRTCWNGLYRVNRSGKFNVPFGRLSNPTICDPDRICSAAGPLARATLRADDFGTILRTAREGDFVYLDPPYITGHRHNGFHRYNGKLFSWHDQERLAKQAAKLSERGVYVLVSNADHTDVNALYSSFRHYRAHRGSLIASATQFRSTVSESIFSNYPLCGVD
jgi:DNA adenine methylase